MNHTSQHCTMRVYNKKTAQNHTRMHSNFTLKTTSFWLSTKSEVQSFIRFSISHSDSQNEKFKSLILLLLFCIYLWYLLFILSWFFFFFNHIYLCYFFCYTSYIFFLKLTVTHIVMIINSKLEIGHDILKNYHPKADQITLCTPHIWPQNWG